LDCTNMLEKPLGRKNYGHIPHLPDSRMGLGDHQCGEGHARIATVKRRDNHDEVIVQEKLDGANVGVARVDDVLHPIGRAGWPAVSSPWEQHHHFHNWVFANQDRFLAVLQNGERLCGEWLAQAHGTRYALPHEPFVAFDLMIGERRLPYGEFCQRIQAGAFIRPHLVSRGPAVPVEWVLLELGKYGFHGALDPVEGAVWRVQRKGEVDFLVKYVRPDKVDGFYLPEQTGQDAVWNWRPMREV